ncbi:MAG TPA: beta-ketoacyl-ACP synthase III [Candidatus Marinimicrobia bacterium]|jgi:3-oxoacyl-[acyl-carrier-protein] synthase-3|nr:beta-ketoacyl-ACP synthase III [Candidatus Neomarinimicrobiota bacterium]MDP7217210.1 beta-ketoacyl-ACP synthase III [Candidatus Neomarinimicrobiota bacterium]MDP7437582.1 beta-ketoacyl-ACP synthase III [Candidatus Neomarinimicrobiota bacterium]MDP7653305.1 beta-ketoacyl-ACP synthase III [Candidatus Neomarinimicrobiota bacterium]HBN46007.1 3-oxoacyl-ACP synthase [Candidatus Neomarinimicrobiota bacterium]|tara:strand:- start:1129 stop:2118 length:990 start_codon:yes stop_codon:yes gene_type:complete
MKAKITATARYLPERTLTNADLEKMVETTDEWIRSRTGIENRHLVGEGEATSDMGAAITKQLLERSGKAAADIDLILVATSTPDFQVVSSAALVQDKVGAENAWGFDIVAACTGFVYAMETGAKMIESGRYNNVIVIGADTMSSIIDYTDRNTCIIFGDGGGGVLLEPSDNEYGVLDSILHTDGSGSQYLTVPAGGSLHPASKDTIEKKMHYVYQDGKTVFKFAVKNMADVSKQILDKNNLTGDDIALFIPHQANRRIIDATAERCGLRKDQILVNINRYGNTTAGTIPIALDEAVETDRLDENDLLLLAAFGGGFTWGSMLIRWGSIS